MGRQKKSVWQLINPIISGALKDIGQWIQSSTHTNFILCHFRIENAATVLFSYGHEISLQTIEKIPALLAQEFGDDTKVIRVGIEDFILVSEAAEKTVILKKIDEVLMQIRTFGTTHETNPMFIKFKIGATFLNKQDDLEHKIDEAFIALYEALGNPTTPYVIFDNLSKELGNFKHNMQLASKFQNIINEKKLRLAFQPVICSKTGQIKSYEALLRVIDENGQLTSAGEYVGVAEKFGYIDQVDLLVLELAAKELALDANVNLGINVSALSLDNKRWIKLARKLLKDPDHASRLIVELTETGFQSSMDKVKKFVDDVQSLGCLVAIDDFGAGYTSFTQLKVLNADILKIDGVFIRDLADNYDNQLFVKTLVGFAKAFGLKTVAEYVETGEAAKLLIDMGVDYLQGYYFGKALNYRPWIKEDTVA
jgi:EAL domain-containing protein (putative c-di-GMP-specific phosphodiesterase class I)/GGDEF domain-containing protein